MLLHLSRSYCCGKGDEQKIAFGSSSGKLMFDLSRPLFLVRRCVLELPGCNIWRPRRDFEQALRKLIALIEMESVIPWFGMPEARAWHSAPRVSFFCP